MGLARDSSFAALLQVAAIMLSLSLTTGAAKAQDVRFPSFDGTTQLTGVLMRPARSGTRPAVVLLHGCGGLLREGRMRAIYRSWSRIITDAGYVALVVDSATPRGFGQTCTDSPGRTVALRDRATDAFGALRYLQAQRFVPPDRIAAVGWSQGGSTILNTVAARSPFRPQPLDHDFRAAVAFYPGGCSDRLQQVRTGTPVGTWTTPIPLLVLFGEADNWSLAAACEELMQGAKGRGAPVEFKLYPGALHAFDAPNLSRRELPEYRLRNGTVPAIGTDPAARADAITRVAAFLRQHLGE